MLPDDVRYAVRLMLRNPGFTAVAVLSLALGIGANTAIFSLFYTVMLRQLPVRHPEQLVELLRTAPGEPRNDGYWGWEKYQYFRDHNHVLSEITGTSFDNLASVRTEGSDPETLVLENVVADYFQVLGLKPSMGRLLGPEDVRPNSASDAVVVSWSYWNTRLHRDPAVVGRRIWYRDTPKTIVGVAPRAYTGPRVGVRTDIWEAVDRYDISMIARLKPGVTIRRAEAELTVLYRGWLLQNGANSRTARTKVELEPAGAGLQRVRARYGKPLELLLGIVGVLLLGCINMAGMLLARAAARQRELAVRVGLGAGRGRLLRQMLAESLLLSSAGTLAGIVVAYAGIGVLVRIMAGGRAFERVEIQVHPDAMLLLFTGGIALVTGVLFGLAPGWYAFRSAPAAGLRQIAPAGSTWFWSLFGKGLVTAQVALSILLVTAAAVFLNHLSRLRDFDLGFRSDHVLLVTLDPARSGYKPEQLAARYRELLARIGTIPQVRSVSVSGCTPLEGCGSGSRYIVAEGHVERPEDRPRPAISFVAPEYFKTLGIPLLAGRDFSLSDAGRPRVAIVSAALARHYFPGVNPIGRYRGPWLGR